MEYTGIFCEERFFDKTTKYTLNLLAAHKII